MTTLIQTYDEQEEETIITPAEGKRIVVWNIKARYANNIVLGFASRELLALSGDGEIINPSMFSNEGGIDESLVLSCGAGTTIKILYEEVE